MIHLELLLRLGIWVKIDNICRKRKTFNFWDWYAPFGTLSVAIGSTLLAILSVSEAITICLNWKENFDRMTETN